MILYSIIIIMHRQLIKREIINEMNFQLNFKWNASVYTMKRKEYKKLMTNKNNEIEQN